MSKAPAAKTLEELLAALVEICGHAFTDRDGHRWKMRLASIESGQPVFSFVRVDVAQS